MQDVLRALAGGEEGLITKESAELMVAPQLKKQQREELEKIVYGEEVTWLTPLLERKAEGPLDYGLAGMINLEDMEGRRRAGSMMWLGIAGSHWVSLFPSSYTRL